MSQNIGTLITAPIRPNDSLDPIASAFQNELQGGAHSYQTIAERDSIFAARRQWGMIVTVYDDSPTLNGIYTLRYNQVDTDIMNNANWVVFGSPEPFAQVLSVNNKTEGNNIILSTGDNLILSEDDNVRAFSYNGRTVDFVANLVWTEISEGRLVVYAGATNTNNVNWVSVDATQTRINFYNTATGFSGQINGGSISANRVWTMPDATGLVALKRVTRFMPGTAGDANVVTHNLNTTNIIVQLWDITTGAMITANTIDNVTETTVDITFGSNPSGEVKAIIMG